MHEIHQSDTAFDLESFLPYLLNQAAEATSRSFQAIYKAEYGMTRTQWRVLANLGKFGAMTATGICRISHIEKTKVSRAVAALEQRGFLARVASQADKRSETLWLTADGAGVFRHLGQLAQTHDANLRARLGGSATEALEQVLRGLAASLPPADGADD